MAFRAGPDTTTHERAQFFGPGAAQAVLALDATWFERAAHCTLWLYELAAQPFVCVAANAGYFVAAQAVRPLSCRRLDQPLVELLGADVELRVVPDLRSLAQAVAASSLAFSCIRMSNLPDCNHDVPTQDPVL